MRIHDPALHAALLLLTITFTVSCSATGPAVDPALGAESVVAEVDGEPITLAELDEEIVSELHDLRAQALEQLIEKRALSRAAEQRGLEVDALIEQETAKLDPVSDEEVAKFFDDNASRIPPGATLADVGPRIRELLEEARGREAVDALLEGLDVAIYLTPPRIPVEAIGPALGPAEAVITIVEWSDYECPYCARAEPVLQELLALYPTQVRWVYRHMPLPFHAQARPAAIAAVCAEEQDRFWDYHERLFSNQSELSSEAFGRLADEVGLDRSAFDTCIAGSDAADRVDRDMRDAERAGATATPSFNVNGIQFSGARSLEAFVEVVEQELERVEQAGGA